MTNKQKTIKLCICAMFSALLVGGKYALAVVPNVEVVTIIIAVVSFVWGIGVALPMVNVFIVIDTLIMGFNTWVISYLLHWNFVAVVFAISSKLVANKRCQNAVCCALAVVVTFLFGVTTSLVDTLIGYVPHQGFYCVSSEFVTRFAILYANGIVFFVIHVVSNLAIFAVLFGVLVKLNVQAKIKLLDE